MVSSRASQVHFIKEAGKHGSSREEKKKLYKGIDLRQRQKILKYFTKARLNTEI